MFTDKKITQTLNIPIIFACGAMVANTAYGAQQNEIDSQQSDPDSIERIVVTADLSQRNLSELPASALVLNEQSIELRQATHLQDLIGMAPNLNFSSGASRGKFLQIRGIGERSQFAEPINPSIGLLIDNIDISGIGGLATTFDLAQVEVLSGPQSVASGVNSIGGIVKLVSNAPTSDLYANVGLSYGEFNESKLTGTYSNALTDNVSTRFSFGRAKSDGFITNDFLQTDNTNNIDETTITAIGEVSLNDNSELSLNVYKFDIDNGYDAFSLDNTVTLSDQPGFDKLDAVAGSLQYNYRFVAHEIEVNAFTLQLDSEYGYDEDWTFTGIHPDGYSSFDFYARDISRTGIDIKFANRPQTKHGQYVIGLSTTRNTEDLLRQNTFLEADYTSTYQPTNYSIYGQYVYAINSDTTLTSAVRGERFSADFTDAIGSTSLDDTLVAASFAIDHMLNDNLLFASISRGYKAGGFNIDSRLAANNRSFAPEYNMNYELGIKGRAYNGMANLNLTFFYMQRNDAQVSDSVLFSIDDSGASSFADAIGNADTGTNKGIEISATWDISNDWYLQTNVGYLDATFGNYTKIDGEFVATQAQAHAPNYTAHLASTWQVYDTLSWYVDVDIKDEFRLGINHNVKAPFSAVFNTALTWNSTGKHLYSIKLWAKNITDRAVVTRGFGSFPNDPRDGYSTNGPYFQFAHPRQIGISLSYTWE